MNRHLLLEALESRIAPATLIHPLPDVVAGTLATGAEVDLGFMFDADAAAPYRTRVEFLTNYDTDAETHGLQPGRIVLELFDESAPLTVQNFLHYVEQAIAAGDYDNTFFHRSVTGFVLQGGGFEVTDLDSHIPTSPYVHNEFSALRSNVAGTIAMAKGAGAHSATSEFFFNLADNSANLNYQNGGFTVFGRVAEGMEVVNAIASLPVADLKTITGNGALETTPIQGGYTPASGVAPTANQLIQITDARILAPEDGVSEGLSFSAVVTTSEGNATNLVSAKITGDTLSLQYRSGGSGISKVTVTARDSAGNFAGIDEFNVTVQPNLITTVDGDNLYGTVVPGDKGLAKVTIWNTAGGTAKGQLKVRFYLSLLDDQFQEIDAPDLQIGEAVRSINLLPGRSASVTGRIAIPPQLIQGDFQYFRILAEVTSPEGTRHISEVGNYTDDNLSLDTQSYHELRNWFGTFQSGNGFRKNVPLTYSVDGHPVKVTLTGGGLGALVLDADSRIDLITTDTNAASALTVKSNAAAFNAIRHVELSIGSVPSPIGSVNLATTTVYGNVVAYGGLKSLTLGTMVGIYEDSVIALGEFATNPAQAATMRVANVSDYNFTSAMPVKTFTTADWLNSDDIPEALTFASLGSFTSKSNLEASVFVIGTDRLKSFTVAGILNAAIVQVNGDVGRVSLGAMRDSAFLVGATIDQVTTGLNAFTQQRSISSFTITGVVGLTYALTDSLIASAHIGAISIRSVNPSSATDSIFGVIAETINGYHRTNVKLAHLDTPGTPDINGDYRLRILAPLA